MEKKGRGEKLFCILVALFLLAMLLPLFGIGSYNVMSADDYTVGKELHAISDTPNASDVFSFAIAHSKAFYTGWRGCFTINFIDCFNPAFFGENGAKWTPFIMLFILLASSYYFVAAGLKTYFQAEKSKIFLLWSLFVILLLETMPAMVETIYWYSGATAYTVTQGLFFWFFGLLFSMDRKKKPTPLAITMLGILAILLGGCQYTICLEALIWYGTYLALFVYEHKKSPESYKIFALLCLLLGAMANFLAPGNQVRREASAKGMGAFSAILKSFVYAFKFAINSLNPLMLIICILAVPIIWKIAKKLPLTKWYFHPLLVVGYSYCLLASCFTASLFGLGGASAGRIQNQILGFFYLLIFLDLLCIFSYVAGKAAQKKEGIFAGIKKMLNLTEKWGNPILYGCFFLAVLVLFITPNKDRYNSVGALYSLANGEAKTYYEENEERLKLYRDESVLVVSIKPYSVKPKLLYFDDLTENEDDINYWINESIAAYYDKERVLLERGK